MALGYAGGVLDRGDAECILKGLVGNLIAGHVAARDEGDLVAEVGELVVDRGGGEQQHLGADTLPDDVLHEPLVTGAADAFIGVFGFADRVVAEVVRLVDDYEVIVSPVDGGEIDAIDIALFPREVGMGKHIVAEAIFIERVQRTVRAIHRPVPAELLRAEDENPLVFQLEVFDDGERGEGFPKTHAVGEDAAVGGEDLVDRGFRPVLLEGVEGLPDAGVRQRRAGEGVVEILRAIDVVAEQVEESEVVDELRGLVGMETIQLRQNLVTDIAGNCLVVPDLVEPCAEIRDIAPGIDDQV